MTPKKISEKAQALGGLIERSAALLKAAGTPTGELYSELDKTLSRLENILVKAFPVPLDLFERDLPDWKKSWERNSKRLTKFSKEALGSVAEQNGKERAQAYAERLLVECLKKPASRKWREALMMKTEKVSKLTPKFVQDPEANARIKRWGQMSFEAFSLDLKETSPEMLRRAAKVVGLDQRSRSKSFSKTLHGKACHFSNNTSLF